MRYCPYCRRPNPSRPLYCQYCGRTFEVRICGKCHHINPKEALVCRNCGSSELSDIAGETPLWMILLRGLFWLLGLLIVIGFFLNFGLFVPGLMVIGFFLIGYSFLPAESKKIMKAVLGSLKQRVWAKKEKS